MVLPVLIAAVLQYYGGALDTSWTNRPSVARFVPKSASLYRMVQPDGQERVFELVDSKGGVLLGPKPWVGAIKNNRVDIWSDPEKTGGRLRTGYTFVNGQLRMMQADGRRYSFPPGRPCFSDSLSSLFPERHARSWEKGSSGDVWSGDPRRIRLWFANPNDAGMLFAEVALLFVWFSVVLARRRHWPWICALLALSAIYGLLCTGSRGALVAFLAGCMLLMLPFVRKVFCRRGLLVVATVLVVGLSLVVVSGQAERIVGTFQSVDKGNSLRLKVAKSALMMLSDAPLGWTSGEVPGRSACLNWYLFDETHIIRTHLMTLAELGWLNGTLYVFVWASLTLVAFLIYRKRRDVLPLALMAAFALAGFLNPVYREWELWVMPLSAIVASGVATILSVGCGSPRDVAREGAKALAFSVLCVSALAIAGKAMPRSHSVPVHASHGVAVINGDKPRCWIVEDTTVFGRVFPGRDILSYYLRNPKSEPLAYVHDIDDLPESVYKLVLPGRAAEEYLRRLRESGRAPCSAERIVFLSPSVGPDAVPEELTARSKVSWVAGYFAALRDPAYNVPRDWVDLQLGSELYLRGWLALALGNSPVCGYWCYRPCEYEAWILKKMREEVKAGLTHVGYPGKFPNPERAPKAFFSETPVEGFECVPGIPSAPPHGLCRPRRQRFPREKGGVYDLGRLEIGYVTAKSASEPALFVGESLPEVHNSNTNYFEQSTRMEQISPGLWQSRIPLMLRYFRFEGNVQSPCFYSETDFTEPCGAFTCSDARLQKMWRIGANTLRLCTRTLIVDGLKRDRLPWAGDLVVEILSQAYTYGDPEPVKRTLSALGSGDMADGPVNGIGSFSLWWIVAHDLFQRYFGEAGYLRLHYPRIKARMEEIAGHEDARGYYAKDLGWDFIDWTDRKGGELRSEATRQVIYFAALQAGARLADRMGDGASCAAWRAKADALKQKVLASGMDRTRHARALAVVFDLVNGDEAKRYAREIAQGDLPPTVTPYMSTFEVWALAKGGEREAAKRKFESVWGAMTDFGVDCFWEGWDAADKGDQVYEYYGRPYGRSLCHAWASGPAFLIPGVFLGVQPASDGWRTFEVKPLMPDIAPNARVTVPSRQGAMVFEDFHTACPLPTTKR